MSVIVMLLDNAFVSDLRVTKEAESLVAEGYKVKVVCVKDAQCEEEEVINGVEVYRWIPPLFHRPFSRAWKAERSSLLQRLQEMEMDVLHCHDYMMIDIGLRLKALRPSLPLVYDAHEYFRGLPFHASLGSWTARWKGWIVWRYFLRRERKGLRTATAVITTTPAIAALLKKRSGSKLHPMVLPNVSSLTPTDNQEHSLRTTLGIGDEERILVQSGNLYQPEGMLAEMCEAIAQLSGWHFVVLNDRPIADRVRTMISAHPHWPSRIHVLPYHTNHLADQLQSADAGLLYVRSHQWKSHYLTSPNRLMEYQHFGLPVLTVAQAEAERFAEHGHILFYAHDRVESFIEQVQALDKELKHYQQRAQRLQGAITWETVFLPILKLYAIIIENSSK